MNKKKYVFPEIEVIIPKDNLLDSVPVHFSTENEGDIESKQGSWTDDTETEDYFHHKDLWEE